MLLVSSSAGLCNRTIIPPPASLAQTSPTITVTTTHSSSYTHPRGWLKNGGEDKEIAKFKEVENVAFVVASALLSHAWSHLFRSDGSACHTLCLRTLCPPVLTFTVTFKFKQIPDVVSFCFVCLERISILIPKRERRPLLLLLL